MTTLLDLSQACLDEIFKYFSNVSHLRKLCATGSQLLQYRVLSQNRPVLRTNFSIPDLRFLDQLISSRRIYSDTNYDNSPCSLQVRINYKGPSLWKPSVSIAILINLLQSQLTKLELDVFTSKLHLLPTFSENVVTGETLELASNKKVPFGTLQSLVKDCSHRQSQFKYHELFSVSIKELKLNYNHLTSLSIRTKIFTDDECRFWLQLFLAPSSSLESLSLDVLFCSRLCKRWSLTLPSSLKSLTITVDHAEYDSSENDDVGYDLREFNFDLQIIIPKHSIAPKLESVVIEYHQVNVLFLEKECSGIETPVLVEPYVFDHLKQIRIKHGYNTFYNWPDHRFSGFMLNHWSHLECVCLENLFISKEGKQLLESALSVASRMTTFKMVDCILFEDISNSDQLLKFSSLPTTLTNLHIQDNEGCLWPNNDFGELLKPLINLQVLILENVNLDDEAKIMKFSSKLKFLSLTATYIDALPNGFADQFDELTHLVFNNNQLRKISPDQMPACIENITVGIDDLNVNTPFLDWSRLTKLNYLCINLDMSGEEPAIEIEHLLLSSEKFLMHCPQSLIHLQLPLLSDCCRRVDAYFANFVKTRARIYNNLGERATIKEDGDQYKLEWK